MSAAQRPRSRPYTRAPCREHTFVPPAFLLSPTQAVPWGPFTGGIYRWSMPVGTGYNKVPQTHHQVRHPPQRPPKEKGRRPYVLDPERLGQKGIHVEKVGSKWQWTET